MIKLKDILIEEVNSNITLNDKEYEFLVLLSHKRELLRILMSSDEVKIANKLKKLNLINKGTSDAKHGTTIYYINRNGENYLDEKH